MGTIGVAQRGKWIGRGNCLMACILVLKGRTVGQRDRAGLGGASGVRVLGRGALKQAKQATCHKGLGQLKIPAH